MKPTVQQLLGNSSTLSCNAEMSADKLHIVVVVVVVVVVICVEMILDWFRCSTA